MQNRFNREGNGLDDSATVREFYLLVLERILVYVPRYFYILKAIRFQFIDFALFPEFNGLEPVSALSDAKRGMRNIVQLNAKPQMLLDFLEKIKGWNAAQIARVIRLQAWNIESVRVIADNAVASFESRPERWEVLLQKSLERIRFIKIYADQRYLQERRVIRAYILEGILCFNIENSFFSHRTRRTVSYALPGAKSFRVLADALPRMLRYACVWVSFLSDTE